MITKALKKLLSHRQRVGKRRKARLLEQRSPFSPSSDDTYIVEFPKAGSTWFSFLIANVNLQINKSPIKVTWWNLREYVFDVDDHRDVPANPFPLPHGRFIHSHADFNRLYGRVLYLVRDPRDVFVSYYDMKTELGEFQGTMDTFLASEDYGIPAWNRHVGGWLRGHTPANYIQFFRYEDLKTHPSAILDRVHKLYGIDVDPSILENAVERSSLAAMRQSEQFYREKSYDFKPEFKFVRKGVSGGFSDALNPAQISLIEENCAEWMQIFDHLPVSKSPENGP